MEGLELTEGIKVGILEGNTVGIAVNVGLEVELGAYVGLKEGDCVEGFAVGSAVRTYEGEAVGLVGDTVGKTLGENVGS